MFELDGKKSWVEAQPAEVVYLATSINRPAVAPPDRAPETAQAYVCTLRRAQGYFVYIYLHLVSTNTGLLYRWSKGAVSAEMVESLQQNAQEFTESMGFMMDGLRFSEMAPDQQAETFARTPLFHQDISFLKSEDESVAELEIVEPEEGGGEEVVIEAVEEEAAEAEAAEVEESPPPAEPEVEEITLDVMSSDEIAPGIAESAADQSAAAPAEEEIALGGSLAEPAQAEEDILLDQLEVKAEPSPPPPPFPEPDPEPVREAEPAGAAEAVAEAESAETEISVEAEESSALLDALEAQAEEAPPLPTPAPAAEPAQAETPEIEEETIEVLAAEAPAAPAVAPPVNDPPFTESEVTEDENAFLVRLLAMM